MQLNLSVVPSKNLILISTAEGCRYSLYSVLFSARINHLLKNNLANLSL